MKLYNLLNKDLLNKHLENRTVGVQRHPVLPIRIFNYTHLAQYQHPIIWNDGTIDYCRGLIVDDQDNIISRPFKKFHNLNTESIPETMESNLPHDHPVVTKKYDGSLGIYYKYESYEGIATRGSFTSDQAKWATAWYLNHQNKKKTIWPEFLAPLFEIIYNENRIVVKYDFEGLVLLVLVHKETGIEENYARLETYSKYADIPVTEILQDKPLAELVQMNDPNEEGYVLTYETEGYKLFPTEPLKLKVKMADYVRLHRIITGLNPRTIWESLSNPAINEINLSELPQNVVDWYSKWILRLQTEFNDIEDQARLIYSNRPIARHSDTRRYRKECAEYMLSLKDQQHLKGLFFGLLDDRDISGMIWDMIEPRGNDKSFLTEEQ